MPEQPYSGNYSLIYRTESQWLGIFLIFKEAFFSERKISDTLLGRLIRKITTQALLQKASTQLHNPALLAWV